MAEYIDRDDLLKELCTVSAPTPSESWIVEKCIEKVNEQPTADVAEVVRCKDCVWWEARTFGSTIGRCENPRNGLVNEYSEENDFCSYGERKE